MTIPVEDACRAHQAIVVQGLNHRNTCLLASRENGWGDHDKSIVHVHEAGLLARQQSAYFSSRIRCPNSARDECKPPKARILFDFIVIAKVSHHLVASILQHGT